MIGLLLALVGLLIALLILQVYPLNRRVVLLQGSLADALRRRSLTLQHAGEGICGLDAQGRIEFINPAGERLLGYTLAELAGRSLHETVHQRKADGTDYPFDECPGARTLREGVEIHQVNQVFWRKDGSPVEVDIVSAPVLEHGAVNGAVVVFRDITEQRRALATLTRWQHVFEHAQWGITVGSADGLRLELVNPAFAQMHGYTVDELVGKPVLTVFAPEMHEEFSAHVRLADERGHYVWESWHLRKDGSRFPVQIDVTTVTAAPGQVLYRVVNVQDIATRRAAEARIRRSEAGLARSQAVAHLGSWQIFDTGNDLRQAVEWSAETYRIFDVPPDRPITLGFVFERIHPEDHPPVESAWAAALAGAPYDISHRILTRSGVRWVRERAEVEFDAAGRMTAAIGTVQDITELKAKEDELLASRQMLRELAAHHEQVREQERSRIACEIHDDLGQYLTALRMDTAFLGIRFGQEHPQLQAHLERMKDTIDETIGVTRNVAAALRPGALDLGLAAAAEWLLAGFEKRAGIRCQLDAPAAEDLRIDAERATAVFRILQESLTNVARHAHAGRVWVKIAVAAQDLVLEVEDDGGGFDPAELGGKRTFGLLGMRERALMFGGSFSIDRRAGGGTAVSIRIPVTEGEGQ
ncbi:MAG: PAS domain S-box protein [Nevskia sp.]|nr:PAS domain S-box protein [Nevskia sp.]